MRQSRVTETQMVSILKEAEAGKKARENDALKALIAKKL